MNFPKDFIEVMELKGRKKPIVDFGSDLKRKVENIGDTRGNKEDDYISDEFEESN